MFPPLTHLAVGVDYDESNRFPLMHRTRQMLATEDLHTDDASDSDYSPSETSESDSEEEPHGELAIKLVDRLEIPAVVEGLYQAEADSSRRQKNLPGINQDWFPLYASLRDFIEAYSSMEPAETWEDFEKTVRRELELRDFLYAEGVGQAMVISEKVVNYQTYSRPYLETLEAIDLMTGPTSLAVHLGLSRQQAEYVLTPSAIQVFEEQERHLVEWARYWRKAREEDVQQSSKRTKHEQVADPRRRLKANEYISVVLPQMMMGEDPEWSDTCTMYGAVEYSDVYEGLMEYLSYDEDYDTKGDDRYEQISYRYDEKSLTAAVTIFTVNLAQKLHQMQNLVRCHPYHASRNIGRFYVGSDVEYVIDSLRRVEGPSSWEILRNSLASYRLKKAAHRHLFEESAQSYASTSLQYEGLS